MSGVKSDAFVAPPAPGAAVARLDLVGDQVAAGRPHHLRRARHEAARHVGQALVGEDRADDQAGEARAVVLEAADRAAQALEIGLCKVGFARARHDRPQHLGEGDGAHVAAAVLAGADAGHLADRLAVAVIGGVGADDALLAGGAARHAQRHLVGLGARAAEDDALDRRPVESRDAFRQGDDAFVQVAAVHVERGLLARHRLDDVRVGMPDARHVVVHVDVAAARLVEQMHALAADDVQGLVVEQRRSGSQRPVSAGGKRRRTHAGPLLRGVVWDPIMVSRTAGFQPAHCWERATLWRIFVDHTPHERHGVARSRQRR